MWAEPCLTKSTLWFQLIFLLHGCSYHNYMYVATNCPGFAGLSRLSFWEGCTIDSVGLLCFLSCMVVQGNSYCVHNVTTAECLHCIGLVLLKLSERRKVVRYVNTYVLTGIHEVDQLLCMEQHNYVIIRCIERKKDSLNCLEKIM